MFFQPSNLKSSSIAKFAVNANTNQAMVSYKSNPQTTYLYDNVDIDAIVDVFLGEITSVGKFVNAYCKGNRVTAITAWLL